MGRAFRVPLSLLVRLPGWTWHIIDDVFLCIELCTRFTSDLPSISFRYSDLSGVACILLVAPLSCAILFGRSDLLHSKKAERHRAPFCGTHNFSVILPCGAEATCVAPRAI